jgi:ATP-binding cassette subfamily C protein LapB
MTEVTFAHLIILRVAELFDIPLSLNNVIASSSGFKNLSPVQIVILGLEKLGMHSVVQESEISKIRPDMLPCLAIMKDGKITIINEMVNDELICTDSEGIKNTIKISDFSSNFGNKLVIINHNNDSIQTSVFSRTQKKKNWLWSTIFHFRELYSRTLIATFFANILSLFLPLYAMSIYNKVIPNSSEESLIVLTLGICLAVIFDFLLRNIKSYFLDFANQNTDIILSYKLLNKILHSKLSDRNYLSGSLAGYMRDLEIIREYLSSVTVNTLLDIPFAILYLILLAYIGGFKILMICILMIVLVVFSSMIVKVLSEKYSTSAFHLNNQKTSFLVETLMGLETIKLNLAEKKIQAAWDRISEQHAKSTKANHSIFSLSTNIITLLQSLNYILVIVVGVYSFFHNEISVGALIACMIISSRAVQPFSQASILLMRYNSVKIAYQTLDEIMHSKSEQSSETKYLPKYKLDGAIRFENISFEYEQGKEVLSDVSFEIQPKDKIAIVGVIGSGKTTISKMIMGLYQQSKGNIYIDNFHISQVHPYDLRANIGYVPQDIFLFNGTIMENILLNPLVKVDSKEGLNTAITVSGIDKHFGSAVDGLNTHVGEAGRKISGGQKQSIAIARAFANNPPIILMDEPLSMMDKMTSYNFLDRLQAYTKDKTLIVISHQLSVLNIVDKVLFIEKGKVKFFGPKEIFLQKYSYSKV